MENKSKKPRITKAQRGEVLTLCCPGCSGILQINKEQEVSLVGYEEEEAVEEVAVEDELSGEFAGDPDTSDIDEEEEFVEVEEKKSWVDELWS